MVAVTQADSVEVPTASAPCTTTTSALTTTTAHIALDKVFAEPATWDTTRQRDTLGAPALLCPTVGTWTRATSRFFTMISVTADAVASTLNVLRTRLSTVIPLMVVCTVTLMPLALSAPLMDACTAKTVTHPLSAMNAWMDTISVKTPPPA